MAICTKSDYKTWAGITVTTYDARIDALIPQLQARVETYCRRGFDYGTFTETIDGSGSDAITMRHAPIAAISSITINYTSTWSNTLNSADYSFSTGDDGRVWLLGADVSRVGLDSNGFPRNPPWGYVPRFPEARGNITVVYTGGYGTPNPVMPPDLQLAFFEYLSEALALSAPAGAPSTAGALQGVLKSKTLGKNSETYRDPSERQARLQELFYPWRRPIFGA